MRHWLIRYNKRHGFLLEMAEFPTSQLALDARFARERAMIEEQGTLDPNIEVVVLSAESEEMLRRTHGKYFPPPLPHTPKSRFYPDGKAVGRFVEDVIDGVPDWWT